MNVTNATSVVNANITALASTQSQLGAFQLAQARQTSEAPQSMPTYLSSYQATEALSHDALSKIFQGLGQRDRAAHIRHERALAPQAPPTPEPTPEPQGDCTISIRAGKESFVTYKGRVNCNWKEPSIEVSVTKNFPLTSTRKGQVVTIEIPKRATDVKCAVTFTTAVSQAEISASKTLEKRELRECKNGRISLTSTTDQRGSAHLFKLNN